MLGGTDRHKGCCYKVLENSIVLEVSLNCLYSSLKLAESLHLVSHEHLPALGGNRKRVNFTWCQPQIPVS